MTDDFDIWIECGEMEKIHWVNCRLSSKFVRAEMQRTLPLLFTFVSNRLPVNWKKFSFSTTNNLCKLKLLFFGAHLWQWQMRKSDTHFFLLRYSETWIGDQSINHIKFCSVQKLFNFLTSTHNFFLSQRKI